MLELQASPTELSTAATDLLLGLGCILAAWRLGKGNAAFRRGTWRAFFALLAVASLLGSVVHGMRLPVNLVAVLWHPLYLALALAAALMLIGALHDAVGESGARRCRGPLLIAGLAAYLATQMLDGDFLVFVVFEGVVTLVAGVLYVRLAVAGSLPGAVAIASGLALNLVAGGVQASSLELEIIFELDHNGLFHIVLMPALLLIYYGVERGLRQSARDRVIDTARLGDAGQCRGRDTGLR